MESDGKATDGQAVNFDGASDMSPRLLPYSLSPFNPISNLPYLPPLSRFFQILPLKPVIVEVILTFRRKYRPSPSPMKRTTIPCTREEPPAAREEPPTDQETPPPAQNGPRAAPAFSPPLPTENPRTRRYPIIYSQGIIVPFILTFQEEEQRHQNEREDQKRQRRLEHENED